MSRLWAITSYFNPAGFRRRLENYRRFRSHLSVPLATAEISYTGEFVLQDSDADLLLRFRSDHVMWQKERLLNVLVEHLPETCDCVAWIDCDVIFESEGWASLATEALERHALVHLYDHRVNLPSEVVIEDDFRADAVPDVSAPTPSAIYLMLKGEATGDDFRNADVPVRARSTVGLAWASSRSVLEDHGLYDACVVGGADRAILGAALGLYDIGVLALKMRGPMEDHYRAWAHGFFGAVQGRVGHIPGRAFHLWHGDLPDRQYSSRLDVLNDHGFDPYSDISLDRQGLWQWSSEKPRLHRDIRAYFESRNEDGPEGARTPMT